MFGRVNRKVKAIGFFFRIKVLLIYNFIRFYMGFVIRKGYEGMVGLEDWEELGGEIGGRI